ncbi:MAG: diacylglycerol kinase [Clostridium sp.]|jgi:diacylglycerol kinase (ATP)|nr:diacylglycerol kinase [Clostridium sp.]CCZ18718.1 diacylglycerol kinase [Clostridium sp. CAG:780]
MKKDEHKLKNDNFIEAWYNAINGIVYTATTQRNFRIQLVLAVIVLALSLFYGLGTTEFLCLVFALFFVIFAEMVNTAIETVVDLFVDVYHPKAKIAKDVAAGAVVLSACNALIVGYFIFFNAENMKAISDSIFNNMVKSPQHLAFVAIILVVIAVIAIKASCSKKKERGQLIKEGFVPSGQSAVAFAALTAIWINSKDIVTFTLALVLSLLVVGNRVYNNARTKAEVVFGACMGVLIVMLVYGLTIFKIQ